MNFKKILVVGIGATLLLAGCSSETGNTEKPKGKEETPVKKEETKKEFKFNEAITFDHYNGGKYKATFEGVRLTDERNEFAEIKPKKVVFVDFNFENIDVQEDVFVTDGVEFKVMDGEKNVLQTYPVNDESRFPNPVPAGAKSKGTTAFAIESDSNEVIIAVYNKDKIIGEIKAPLQ